MEASTTPEFALQWDAQKWYEEGRITEKEFKLIDRVLQNAREREQTLKSLERGGFQLLRDNKTSLALLLTDPNEDVRNFASHIQRTYAWEFMSAAERRIEIERIKQAMPSQIRQTLATNIVGKKSEK